jgi:hypothetical protein
VQGLKGSDKVLHDILSPEWSCRFFPVLLQDYKVEHGESYMDYFGDDVDEKWCVQTSTYSKQVYPFTTDDLHYLAVSHLPVLRSLTDSTRACFGAPLRGLFVIRTSSIATA